MGPRGGCAVVGATLFDGPRLSGAVPVALPARAASPPRARSRSGLRPAPRPTGPRPGRARRRPRRDSPDREVFASRIRPVRAAAKHERAGWLSAAPRDPVGYDWHGEHRFRGGESLPDGPAGDGTRRLRIPVSSGQRASAAPGRTLVRCPRGPRACVPSEYDTAGLPPFPATCPRRAPSTRRLPGTPRSPARAASGTPGYAASTRVFRRSSTSGVVVGGTAHRTCTSAPSCRPRRNPDGHPSSGAGRSSGDRSHLHHQATADSLKESRTAL